MRATIFGAGYVGLVTATCLADAGHEIVCVDIDQAKIECLRSGTVPIHEPGLSSMMKRALVAGTLRFATDAAAAVGHADMQIVAVGTPAASNGAADVKAVFFVAEAIARLMQTSKLVVLKSTVPVGTAEQVRVRMSSILSKRHVRVSCEVAANPEFLKEGSAVADFLKPDRIVLGTSSENACQLLKQLYAPFNRSRDRTICMDIRSAELTKYAANAMLATKISFINEIANLAECLGADIESVRQGIGADPRIGYEFIYPGIGYGGSCFPKDVRALINTAHELGKTIPLVEAVHAVNEQQKIDLFERIAKHFGGTFLLQGKTIAIWGLSFKPNTDDMRDAPSRFLIDSLSDCGCNIQAFDPMAMDEARRIYGNSVRMTFAKDMYSALTDADALVVCTEWQQFRTANLTEMKGRLKSKTIFDGRNIYDPQQLHEEDWTHFSIGRPPHYQRPIEIRAAS
jgi:UDPglucose 6-dehydrogenase